MRKILLLFAILLLITSCAKEEQIQPQPVGPACGNWIIEQGEQCDPPGPECSLFCQIIIIPPTQPPEQPPVTPPVAPEPNITPQPPAVVSNLPECAIIGKKGYVYSEANVGGIYIPGQQITNEQSEDLSVCYPYFSKTAATTASVCCVI